MPHITNAYNVTPTFAAFWDKERVGAFDQLVAEERLKPKELQGVIENYLYTEQEPLGDEIVNMLEEKPKILTRRNTIDRVLEKVKKFVKTFFNGVNNKAA